MRVYIILGLAAAILLTVTAWLILGNKFFLSMGAEQIHMSTDNNNPVDDPCWFRTRAGMESADEGIPGRSWEILEKIRDRQLFGFKEETPISEAVRIFNLEEIQCRPYFKEYPPLTEDELIAAIIVGVNQNKRGTVFHEERDALWRIVTKRMMLKGSLLRADQGGNIQESPLAPWGTINAKGIEIYLHLGADKNGRADLGAPINDEEKLIIRKTFYGIEIKQPKLF